MGKTVTLEDHNETDCDNSVSNMKNKQKGKGKKKENYIDFFFIVTSAATCQNTLAVVQLQD